MIYVVTKQQELFNSEVYTLISVNDSINMISKWDVIQFDTETQGVDAHIAKVLCAQFGNKKANAQIVVDCTSVDLRIYKELLESKLVIGQNLYFDLQFLYNYGIICRWVYDTMIVEQLLYLGYPSVTKGGPSMGLAAIAKRRLGIDIDKSIRGKIIYLGLTEEVIKYAANDVVWLEDIMWSQIRDCELKSCIEAAHIECNFVPVLAYGAWCGIKLDTEKWKEKMQKDLKDLDDAVNKLNKFVINTHNPKFITGPQLDLFEDVSTEPQSLIEWTKPGKKAPRGNKERIAAFIKYLGFDISKLDEENNQDKESIDLKGLNKQKGINDEFLKIYNDYSASYKVVSTYGITYLNAINPITGRIHTSFKQLAADTGRIACGNGEEGEELKINPDLAKLKGFPLKTDDVSKKCGYPNIQTLPSDEITRTCFISEKGNRFCSCDWSAIESRLGADIYQEQAMIEEFLHGSGDMHSLVAKMVFKELKDVPVKDIKALRPDLRKKAKPIEFSQQFGGSAEAIRNSMGCSYQEAQEFADAYNSGFKGIAKFKEKGSKFVRSNGYILLNPKTGHKTYWWDWDKWVERQKSFTPEFWENYKVIKEKKNRAKANGKPVHYYMTNEEARVNDMVSMHFKAAALWDRKALNSVTQGTGAICLKVAGKMYFDWIVDNGYFGKVLIVDFVHDELCSEYPEELEGTDKILEGIMEKAASIYCESLPIPAEAATSNHWVH